MKKIRIFAFGGNEVSPTGLKDEKGNEIQASVPLQFQQTARTCRQIAKIIQRNPKDKYLLTHGNGPQVGSILLRSEIASSVIYQIQLDLCVADTQGGMGFMISQMQHNAFQELGIYRAISTIITRVEVAQDDPAFKNPTKFIGSAYTKEQVAEREKEGWIMKYYKKDSQGNEIWRRVVPSPKPIDIVDFDAIIACMKNDIIPITVGGGGIPVYKVKIEDLSDKKIAKSRFDIQFEFAKNIEKPVIYSGVDAVIDKDLASSLLGRKIIKYNEENKKRAEVSLTIFTGEDGIKLNYQQPNEKSIRKIKVSELKKLKEEYPDQFPAGSMGPKVDAVIDFVSNGGHIAYITKTDLFDETLKGNAGTTIIPD